MKPINKKAQAGIITTVLIILIVIVGIAIVWNVVNPLIKEKSGEVELRGFTTNLEIQEVIVFENQVSHVTVNRKSGGELDGLRFVFYDEQGISKIKDEEGLEELETKIYEFSSIEGLGKLDKVSVAPILNNRLGLESETQTSDVFEIPSGVFIWKKAHETGFIDYSSNLSLSFENQLGISFWVNGSGSVSIDDYQVSYANDNVSLSINNNYFEFENLEPKGWNHIVISIAPAFSKIYINTEVIVFDTQTLNINNKIVDVDENVDDIIVFNKALFSTDVDGLYNNQMK